MLTDEETENLHKVREEGHFLNREVAHYVTRISS